MCVFGVQKAVSLYSDRDRCHSINFPRELNLQSIVTQGMCVVHVPVCGEQYFSGRFDRGSFLASLLLGEYLS